MDGLLIVDKPAGITSHDVVDRVRRILGTRRVGHTGTLDPFATGVMVVLVGRATRLAQFLDKDEKEYEALLRFGFETKTGDATGVRSAECGMRNEEVAAVLTNTDWPAVLAEFTGEIGQVPPMYSAKKVAGKKLYEHARRGEDVVREPVIVTVKSIQLVNSALPSLHSALRTLRVACSAGTYIRVLAQDIGRALGIGAHLAELRRRRAGRFDLSQSMTLDELEETDDASTKLLPLSEAVAHLTAITMAEDRVEATTNGLSTRVSEAGLAKGDAVRMLNERGELLAVGLYDEADKSIHPKVVLV